MALLFFVVKAGSHLMFAFVSAFQKHVKFPSTSCKCKRLVRKLLIAIDSILEKANADVMCERSLRNICRWSGQF